jgi:hypothetical protein
MPCPPLFANDELNTVKLLPEIAAAPVSALASIVTSNARTTAPNVAVSLGTALSGPLYTTPPPALLGDRTGTGSFSDLYTVPLGAALIVTPTRDIDVGASFTLLNAFGANGTWDVRSSQLFASYRP